MLNSVYILKLRNGRYYTGRTDNIKRRISEHKRGDVNSTRKYLPSKLVTIISFSKKDHAINFEKYLKTGSGLAFRNKHFV